MKEAYPGYEEIITDIGSGVNFTRPGLQKILEYAYEGSLGEIAITYKDRLARIGYELLEHIFYLSGTKIIVENKDEETQDREIAEDVIAIITSFAARMHGQRSYRSQRKNKKLYKYSTSEKSHVKSKKTPTKTKKRNKKNVKKMDK